MFFGRKIFRLKHFRPKMFSAEMFFGWRFLLFEQEKYFLFDQERSLLFQQERSLLFEQTRSLLFEQQRSLLFEQERSLLFSCYGRYGKSTPDPPVRLRNDLEYAEAVSVAVDDARNVNKTVPLCLRELHPHAAALAQMPEVQKALSLTSEVLVSTSAGACMPLLACRMIG